MSTAKGYVVELLVETVDLVGEERQLTLRYQRQAQLLESCVVRIHDGGRCLRTAGGAVQLSLMPMPGCYVDPLGRVCCDVDEDRVAVGLLRVAAAIAWVEAWEAERADAALPTPPRRLRTVEEVLAEERRAGRRAS